MRWVIDMCMAVYARSNLHNNFSDRGNNVGPSANANSENYSLVSLSCPDHSNLPPQRPCPY
jgi:hypothetical protein